MYEGKSASGPSGDICASSIDAPRFITGLEFIEVVGRLAAMIEERRWAATNGKS